MALLNVVGFDPSFTNWGTAWATIDTTFCTISVERLKLVSTSKGKGSQVRVSSDRLARGQELARHVRESCEGQQIIFSEIPTGSQSAVAAMGLGIAVGILSSCTTPIIQVTPNETKMRTIGKKNASKNEMIEWAMGLYPSLNWATVKRKGILKPANKNEHLADAVAVIHAGTVSDQFLQLRALYNVEDCRTTKITPKPTIVI